MKVRGRFDILVPFDDGEAYVRFTSDKTRSLSLQEILSALREYVGYLEHATHVKSVAISEEPHS